MQDDILPSPDDQHKSFTLFDWNQPIGEVLGPIRVGEPFPHPELVEELRKSLEHVEVRLVAVPKTKPRTPRAPRKSGLYAVLHAAQQFGITHPKDGFWTMLPKEFDAILALEHKSVIQVTMEILRQTIGTVEQAEDGRMKDQRAHSNRKLRFQGFCRSIRFFERVFWSFYSTVRSDMQY